jgi:diguanylate cyclase (GGDEF)-like protein/PAS domain S-box-containing protein
MAVKPKLSVKSKTSSKHKAAVKPNKKISSRQSDFSHLAEDMISNISVGIYIVQKGNFVYVSPLFQKLSGYSHADLAGTNPVDYIHPDDREVVRKKAIKSLKGKSSDAYEYRFTRKNGEVMWILEMVTSITYKGELAALGSFMDITERKKIEEAIHQSEERYRNILESIQEGYFELDLAGNYTFVNGANGRFLGYTKEELVGMNFRQHTDEENAKKLYQPYRELYLTGKPIKALEVKSIRKDGTKVIYETSISLIRDSEGKPIGFRGVSRDATERKQIEEKIRHSEERYRNILETIEDGYFEVDLSGCYTFVNDIICRHLKYSREELIGMNNRQFQDEENAKKTYQFFVEVYKTGKSVGAFEMEAIRKDGTRQVYEVSISPIRDAEGKTIGFRGISRDINERKQMEEAIRQSEERYRTIIEQMEDGYFEIDLTGNFIFVNNAECINIGYTREELIGHNLHLYKDEKSAKTLYRSFNKVFKTGMPITAYDLEFTKKDGAKAIHEISVSLIRDSQGEPIGFRGISRDITERRQMEETLRQSEERYRTIIEEMEEWYFETDLAGNITFFNDVFANVLRYSQKELTDLNFRSFVKKEESDSVFRLFNQVFKTGKPTKNFPYEFISTDGTVTSAEFSVFPKQDKEGKVCGFRGVGHDITARKRMEEEIQYQATHDALTGLPNRLMFSQLLHHTIQSARRYTRQFAVLFIDLDRFKIINDTLGHVAGDQLLQEIAMRLKQTLRTVDVVARLGGDEFVILIEELSDLSQVETVAGKILSAVIKPVNLMNEECRITASIGISVFPKDAEDEQSLLKNADIAMYLAKEEGKNNYQFYSEDIQSKSLEHLSIETNLRFALERNELSLHYQAKLDFKTNAITGVEALLRWQNPSLGSVTPTQFIPVAEESGLIIPIGRWILRTACAQNAAWQQQGLPPVCMAVNLSLRQLTDNNLIDDIRTALNDSGMAPNLLELEITESMVMHNPTRMIAVLAKIKNLGVRLAIDDFGTGYSSLAQIKHFPIDTLKVDRSFIRNIPQDAEDKAVTEAIIAMGKALSLTVVAEGVETVEHMNFLNDHSCDEMQGFYFSKPIAPEQFADLLRKHVPSPGK